VLQQLENSFIALKAVTMKKIIFTLAMGMTLCTAYSQQKQGRVLYERTVQMQLQLPDANAGQQFLSRPHVDKLEVLFGNDQSLRRTVVDDAPEAMEEGGMRIHMMVADANDITYTNFATGGIVDQREFAAKNYIIADTVRKLNWKLTGATSTILNYPCQQAVAQRIGTRMTPVMEDGAMKSREVADTSNIIVWFTLAIPVPAGPEYQAQLPGLILGIDINDGHTVYKAVALTDQVDLLAIKEPTKGKKVTAAAFAIERDKIMANMQRNASGMGRLIHIQ
jgi:GLPGLI family protein